MSRRGRLTLLAALLAAAVSPSLAAVEEIALFPQVIHPATAENRKTIDLLLAQAAKHLSSRYETFVRAAARDSAVGSGGAAAAEFSVAVTAVFNEEPSQSAVTFVMTRVSDGTTALLASLLESIGIRTAILTSPGHVFMAFDSGESEENLWLFQSLQLEAVARDGRVWIPVETTVLGDGFLAAWLEGSRLLRAHTERGEIEFIPVHEVRQEYPPLSGSTFNVVEPVTAAIDELFDESVVGVVERMYDNGLSSLQQRLASRSGSDALKIRNQIGILHARFGEEAEAEQTFRDTIAASPDFIPAYVNLANLRHSSGDYRGAIEVLGDTLGRRPDSVYLNLAMARSHYQSGDARSAGRFFQVVRQRAPILASRYSYIEDASADGGVVRAGAPGAADPLIWAADFD